MDTDFSKVFHLASKNALAGHSPVSPDSKDWPEEWKTIYYKTYPRLAAVPLTLGTVNHPFFDLVKQRRSNRSFGRTPIALEQLSCILKYSCGITDSDLNEEKDHRRAQPSGGARFPIEVYPIVMRSGPDMPAGIYHYNIHYDKLELLKSPDMTDSYLDTFFGYRWAKNASVAIIMTAVFWRNQHKYGLRGYRHVLFEAGHIGQNIYLVCAALGLKCCALAATQDGPLERELDIDGTTESVVYGLVVGA